MGCINYNVTVSLLHGIQFKTLCLALKNSYQLLSFCRPFLFHLGILIYFSRGYLIALLAKEYFVPKY